MKVEYRGFEIEVNHEQAGDRNNMYLCVKRISDGWVFESSKITGRNPEEEYIEYLKLQIDYYLDRDKLVRMQV